MRRKSRRKGERNRIKKKEMKGKENLYEGRENQRKKEEGNEWE